MTPLSAIVRLGLILVMVTVARAEDPPREPVRRVSAPPEIQSSWDDLLVGVKTRQDWARRREVLRKRFLELLRDEHKPAKPPLELKRHESTVVDGQYKRWLISYNVEKGERAHAFLGIPLKLNGKAPAVVALHGTYHLGKERLAGLVDNPDKAFLDQLCRRGYIVIAPDHFVAGHRIPPEGPYDTRRFYSRHPEWSAAGKATYEHSIAIDVLETLDQVDPHRIGVVGHSLGGQGALFLAAYDSRIQAAACNCMAAPFRHNRQVQHWARDRWYVYFKHLRPALISDRLPPIDFHEIMALVAPRPMLDVSALNDGDPLTQRQRVLMLMKVIDVYELERAPSNFAFFVHGRGHSVSHESRQLLFAWLDTHLKPRSATQTRLVTE
ncbi:MAG: acetylxylan esterase [Pirellulales bacterium]|nr:acetylxylan esterase [Pirellulales bacterium]